MKNVLLIGDSIRIGYDKSVRSSLEGIANVYFPEDNCKFASSVLRYLHEYYTSLGTEAFTKQTLSCISSALGLEDSPPYVETLYTTYKINPNLVGI